MDVDWQEKSTKASKAKKKKTIDQLRTDDNLSKARWPKSLLVAQGIEVFQYPSYAPTRDQVEIGVRLDGRHYVIAIWRCTNADGE
jgi:hypothetical protein